MSWQDDLNDARLEKGSGWYGCIAPDGWKDIVLQTNEMLSHIDPDYKILQIKEKFGSLRYYYGSAIENPTEQRIMSAIEGWAESKSSHTCQDCGKYGGIRTQFHWILTLCDTCATARGYDLNWEETE